MLIAGLLTLGLAAVLLGSADDALFALRLQEFAVASDAAAFMGRRLAAFTREPVALSVASIAGWALAPAILSVIPGARGKAILAAHPAALILAFGGMGLAASALLLVFVSIGTVAEDDRAETVPLLGITLLLAALCIPRFEAMALAFVSPLFLVAPRDMLARNMASFYVIALLPLTVAIGLGVHFFGLPRPPAETIHPAAIIASIPLSVAPLLLAMLAASQREGRQAAALAVICVGIFLAPGVNAVFAVLALSLAAAVLIRQLDKPPVDLCLAAAVAIAAPVAALHISVP